MSIFADRMTFRTGSADEMRDLGRMLGETLDGGTILALVGELGTGKTTFVQGLTVGLGVEDPREVTSPTFLRIHRYDGRFPVHHVDAYRMAEAAEEFTGLGGDEILEGEGVTVIEWAEKLFRALPAEFLTLRFSHGDTDTEEERFLRVVPRGLRYAEIAARWIRDVATSHGIVPEGLDDG